jgi:hypothetical protein
MVSENSLRPAALRAQFFTPKVYVLGGGQVKDSDPLSARTVDFGAICMVGSVSGCAWGRPRSLSPW